jgi:hypothetical protein
MPWCQDSCVSFQEHELVQWKNVGDQSQGRRNQSLEKKRKHTQNTNFVFLVCAGVRVWLILCCLLAGVHGVRFVAQQKVSGQCDPLSQPCDLVNHDTARVQLIEHYLGGSEKPDVAEEVVSTPFAEGQKAPTIPRISEGLRISFLYELDSSRSQAEVEYLEKKLMPATAAVLSRSIRVPFLAQHIVHPTHAYLHTLHQHFFFPYPTVLQESYAPDDAIYFQGLGSGGCVFR